MGSKVYISIILSSGVLKTHVVIGANDRMKSLNAKIERGRSVLARGCQEPLSKEKGSDVDRGLLVWGGGVKMENVQNCKTHEG